MILQELAKAAKRGVKVRVLVDKAPTSFKMKKHIAEIMKDNNIEIRYYNPAPIYKLSSVQFRNHRKLMVRDGEEAITGGRNIANEYYDLSKDFNFLDRDVTIEGEIVKSMKGTFDHFWDSRLAEVPKKIEEPQPRPEVYGEDPDYQGRKYYYDKDQKFARSLFEPDSEVEKILKILENEGKEHFLENEKRTCPEVSFASDREGASYRETLSPKKYKEDYRFVQREILNWLEHKTQDEVIIDTPYFLNNSITEKLFDYLERRKTKVKLFTNSLASTDAIHISTVFNDSVTSFNAHENFDAFVYKGKYSGERRMHNEDVKNATWGTHSKSIVFSNDSFMVGSFNIDNRSSYYNTELAIFCSGSPELTNDVKENIHKRIENSFRLDSDDCDVNADVGLLKKTMYYLLKIPSHLFEHLL